MGRVSATEGSFEYQKLTSHVSPPSSSLLLCSSYLSKEVFSTYENRNQAFAAAKPHPADIVEAASLAVRQCYVTRVFLPKYGHY